MSEFKKGDKVKTTRSYSETFKTSLVGRVIKTKDLCDNSGAILVTFEECDGNKITLNEDWLQKACSKGMVHKILDRGCVCCHCHCHCCC